MVCVGLCWARVGTILGLSWAILGYVGTFWAMLAPYWAHVGPFWAIFGSVSAFVLDLGISMSLNFRPCNAFAKNAINTRHEYNLWTALLMVFAAICLFVFVSFFYGMLHLGYACLINFGVFCGLPYVGPRVGTILGLSCTILGSCWAIVGYVGTILGSC